MPSAYVSNPSNHPEIGLIVEKTIPAVAARYGPDGSPGTCWFSIAENVKASPAAAPLTLKTKKSIPPLGLQLLRNHHWGLSETLLGLKGYAGAAQNASELPKLYRDGWEEYYRAARLLARCVPLANNDSALNPDQRQETAESYAQQAVALLRQAIANGYEDTAKLKAAEEFSAIRARTDFQSLVPTEPVPR